MDAKDRLLDLADRIGRAGINGFGNEVRDIAESLSADRGEAGMLPDALVPHAKEWYRLCERRFSVERMTISGQLAEAIVEAIGQPQPGRVEGME